MAETTGLKGLCCVPTDRAETTRLKDMCLNNNGDMIIHDNIIVNVRKTP